LFPGSVHVSSEELLQASDIAVWEYAKSFGFSVVTADADFYELAITLGAPPKVVWLKGWDYPTAAAARLIRGQAIRIIEFLEDPEPGFPASLHWTEPGMRLSVKKGA
jgi:predicted nuclease of predicted toxin-antitoxin system